MNESGKPTSNDLLQQVALGAPDGLIVAMLVEGNKEKWKDG